MIVGDGGVMECIFLYLVGPCHGYVLGKTDRIWRMLYGMWLLNLCAIVH